ncbi:MAG: hypothetical protein M1832_002644 [Thelocarpon impressellum]|nr:MAG: hypothetical protein M1832_002644 [Thelocarpon impressellum]
MSRRLSDYERLQQLLLEAEQLFESEHGVEVQGRRIKLRPVGFEADLQYVQREAVETPATFIINHLSSVEAVSREFKLSGRITFDNQPHAMSDESEEVMQRWSEQNLQPSTPGVAAGGPKPRTDQVCVYTEVHGEGNRRRLAFVIEDKPAHKLSTAMLRMGLRPLDIRKDVIDRVTVPTSEDQEAHIQYHSDRLVAAAITQIFSYMIEGGVQYGYITTGEAIVFLHVPSDDPSTVRYHLVEPRADVEAQIEAYPDNAYSHCTALGQVLAFSLLALESKAKPNDWQQRVIEQLTPWAVDYDAMLPPTASMIDLR